MPKVLLVGWDAADWKIVQPLMDRHLMPATRRLVEQGVMGNMATLFPVLSPMLWTSIATGKRPYKHGILGFAEPAPGGGIQPITNLSRKTKAVWNILGQNGLRSTVVGWWPSHPAEPINGVMVSNHYQRAPGPMAHGWPMQPGTVHPQRLRKVLAEQRVHPQELEAEHVLPFIPHAARIDQEKDHRLESCVRMIADCTTIHSCATYLLEHEPWDFMAVYFDAIDHFCHAFMRYHPPQQDWISDADFDLYQHVISAGYVYHDMMLARLIELAGEDVTVVLMSDHGFHPDHLRRRTLPSEPAGPAAEHRDYGIFVMAGPGIRRDELIHGVNLLDVAPTLLTVFGLPVGDDMDGRPLVDAFETPPQVVAIPSWDEVDGDAGRHPAGSHLTPADAHDGIEHLVALGYIDRPSGNAEEAVRDTRRELDYNLARSYMDGGQHGMAVPLLTDLYLAQPLEFRVGIQLAICLQALGSVDDLARLIDDLNSRWRLASDHARSRLKEMAEIARRRRSERGGEAGAASPLSQALFSAAEQQVVKKLRSIARGNPSTLDYLAGWVASACRQFDIALEHFTHAEKSESRVPGFHIQLGDAFLQLKRYDQAGLSFRRALELEPANAAAYMGLARFHLGRRRASQAVTAATQAVALRYHLPAAHYWLGVARAATYDFEGARAAFERAVSQNPNFPEAHVRLARLYARVFKNERREIEHRAAAMQIRGARRRQQRKRLLPELPRIDSMRLEDHLPAWPVEPPAAGRLPSLQQPPVAAEGVARTEDDEPIVVVSGLPRSGTSMMMQMLLVGGIPPMTDGHRAADASNPKGYFEHDRVKELMHRNDWLGDAKSRSIKVVAPLIPHLPQGHGYRVIVLDRDLDEIVASQRRMLQRANHEASAIDDMQLKLFLQQQLSAALRLLRGHRVPIMIVSYADVHRQPAIVAGRVAEFLGRPLDIAAMTTAVDPDLYRERAAAVTVG